MKASSKIYIAFWFVGSIIFSRLLIILLEDIDFLLRIEPHWGSFRIHHITLGIIFLIIAGYLALAGHLSRRGKKIDLALYGIGLGLIADEFLLATKTQSGEMQAYPGEYFSFANTIPALIVLAILLFLAYVGRKRNALR